VPKTTGPEWMTTAEVAERLGVALRDVYRLIDTGQLPAYKIGRLIRLRTADVAAFAGTDEPPLR
jgi:excisionase family DNA binding protein